MPFFESRALCLRAIHWSETSQILSLFTPGRGRVDVMAKGAFRIKGPFGGAIEPFFLMDVTVRGGGRRTEALYVLAEAAVVEPFRGLREGLDRLYAAWYVLEHLRTWVQANDPAPGLFDFSVAALERLAGGVLEGTLISFEMGVLDRVGLRPELSRCVGCGDNLDEPVGFSPDQGGSVCGACGSMDPYSRPVRLGTLRYLDAIGRSGWGAEERIRVDSRLRQEARSILDGFFRFRLGFPFRMRKYIEPGTRAPVRIS